jgi:single-strand DNA-binding protein
VRHGALVEKKEKGEENMAYDLTGKVKLIQETQTFGSGFQKREMVVTVEDGKFPQDINLEFVQDKISLLDALQVGQEVTVTFDIRGREYNGRYFNNLQGWRIQASAGGAGADVPPPPTDVPADLEEYEDDIPF